MMLKNPIIQKNKANPANIKEVDICFAFLSIHSIIKQAQNPKSNLFIFMFKMVAPLLVFTLWISYLFVR